MRTIEERVNQELKQRNEAQLKRLRRVEEWLRPDGLPQERIYSVISPLLINHGMRVIDHLLEQLDLGRTDVQVVEV